MEKFLDFIDEVYVINLPHRFDRRKQMEDHLGGFGIPFTRFEATYDENGVKGLVETMKVLFEVILAKRQENVLILEDDAEFLVQNPVEFLKTVIPQIPARYELFYLGLNLLAVPIRINQNVLKVTDCYSTHAIMYSMEGVKRCLARLKEVPLMPYDIFVRQEILPARLSYCTYPMMATQRQSYSDIEKTTPRWGDLMAMSYSMHTKTIQKIQPDMATEIAHCIYGHEINGVAPTVDHNLFEFQNTEFRDKTCDCGRFTYDEGLCPTCSGDKWKVIWREK